MNTESTAGANRTTTPVAVTHSRTFIAGASIAGAAVVAGVVATVMLAFGSSAAAHTPSAPAAPPTPSHSNSVPATPNNGWNNGGGPVKPNQLPAAQVETIQRELAQLNYYEGPINGVMTPQTVQAITYLQRDADLPQNGEYNQVTYLALQNFLAHGNNQMAG
jgi:peptidoglycan hydrolase-like protein with peptidoglycan-binding domain